MNEDTSDEANVTDELDAIFVDKNEQVDKKLIVDILKDFITIDGEGVINFLEPYSSLKDYQKALIYLASKKAKMLRGIITEDKEGAGPKEISDSAFISESSAKMCVLRDLKGIVKKINGGYIIPNYNMRRVLEVIKNGK